MQDSLFAIGGTKQGLNAQVWNPQLPAAAAASVSALRQEKASSQAWVAGGGGPGGSGNLGATGLVDACDSPGFMV